MMLKILRRKPKEPMTPRQRYKNGLDCLIGCGMIAAFGVCVVAVAVQSAIEEGLPTVSHWVFLVSVVIGCIGLTYLGLRTAARLIRSLMEHAPIDQELEAETSSAPLLNTGEVRDSDILDGMPPSLAPLGLRVRPKLKMAATVVTAAITGVALFLGGLVAAGLIIEAAAGIDDMRTEPGIWITFGVSWTAALVGSFTCYRMARSMLGFLWSNSLIIYQTLTDPRIEVIK